MDNNENHPGASEPQDGEMDFSSYSDAQLNDLELRLDAARFPRELEGLKAEIARRESQSYTRRTSVHFTSSGGLAGWIEALLARQPLYGAGNASAGPNDVILDGWWRTWLGTEQQAQRVISASRIRNVNADQEWLSFDVRRPFLWSRHYTLRTSDPASASALVRFLPQSQSKWFERQQQNLQQYYRLQRDPKRRPWITAALIIACIAIYVAQAATTGYWFGLDGVTLINSGANAANLTVHGGWWRLIAALFLHLNPLHLLINMWVLWSAGRIAERLLGHLSFAAIYFTAGIIGGLLSIGWNPAGSSVGASGAIFGVLGALVAYLIHGRARLPQPVIRAHLVPTILFTLFSVLNGLAQAGIDNASHIGGLLTGLLLGWAVAIPIRSQSGRTLAESLMASFVVILMAAGLLLQATGPASHLNLQEQFLKSQEWYRAGETRNLLKWQEIASDAATGTIAPIDLAQRFEKEIVPFWSNAAPRLRKELLTARPQLRPIIQAVSDFADLRLRWARAIIDSTRTSNAQNAMTLMQKTDVAQARLAWIDLRAQFDQRAFSLAESPVVAYFTNLVRDNYRPCTKSPFTDFNQTAPDDLASDGPAQRQALACQAQKLFLTRDFKKLDATMEAARRHRADLADGTSSYDALNYGIGHLIDYGGLSVDGVMGRMAEWRREVPGSVNADLTEISALVTWAYAARGNGYANTVTAQNEALFQHRIEMADAALQVTAPRAKGYARWYGLAIQVNLLGNGTEEERRAIFDKGHQIFPDDFDIYTAMLHSLMPRWGGSYQKIASFIVEQAREKPAAMPPMERYARLYWEYARLEGSEADIFKDAYAKSEGVSLGLAIAEKRFPKSDYLVNVAGRVACQTDQRVEYLVFHSMLPKHYSATAWSPAPGLTVEACNKKFGLGS